MPAKLIMTGDVNLMNVTDPAQPFTKVRDEMASADVVFSNMECCLFNRPAAHSADDEGFFADPDIGGKALRLAGIHAVGIANNVTYGTDAINSTLAQLRKEGVPSTGAGRNREEARAPVILNRNGLRYGFIQRSSVYWETNHEAGENSPGIAVMRAHTAYQVPQFKPTPGSPPLNRPGIPPLVLTWVDPNYLGYLREDIAALRAQVDIVVASFHWGLRKDTMPYMHELAHAAIDAGADAVIGHGPHYSLAVEMYKGHPIYYGLGGFCFHTGHQGVKHGNWIGMVARLSVEKNKVLSAGFQFVRHNDDNETYFCKLADEQAELDDLAKRSVAFKTRLTPRGDEVMIESA